MPITLKQLSAKLNKRSDMVDAYATDALKRRLSTVGEALIKGSPVDTGRFKGGWRASGRNPQFTSPSRSGLNPKQYNRIKRNPKTGERTSSGKANAKIEEKASLVELEKVAGSLKAGDKIAYMANNVPYAGKLNRMGTRWGPNRVGPGFIQRIIMSASKKRAAQPRKKIFKS